MSCLIYYVWLFLCALPSHCSHDGPRITALLGESVILHCAIDFPEGQIVPYIIRWTKQGYPPHVNEEYEGRVSRVMNDGQASLNLSNVVSSDQGWYECQVLFLNREPRSTVKNGTWIYLDVHAPPRFIVTSDDIVYVNLGDSIILTCEAEGTPLPRIMWYKESDPIVPSATIAIMNDGSELRVTEIKESDIGDYVCIAKNGEGRIHHTTKVVIAGGPVILVPPQNITKIEGDKSELACEPRGMPNNISISWFKETVPIHQVESLEGRATVKKDGTLIIHPLTAEDTGKYTCQVSNGIGTPQSASAYLNVELLATSLERDPPLSHRSQSPLKFVTWTKDKRVFKPSTIPEIVELSNGSLHFYKVSHDHEGEYRCTPYNAVGTAGSSEVIQVLVREPPVFTIRPSTSYQQKKGRDVTIPCAAEGNPRPSISWRRVGWHPLRSGGSAFPPQHDGKPLPKTRTELNQGNLTIRNLREEDFAYYECIATNEIATIVSATQLLVEGSRPQPPHNISVNASEYAVSLQWFPGYSGGEDYKQEYVIWYNEAGEPRERASQKVAPGKTSITIYNLLPNTSYEFEITSKNRLGDSMVSALVKATTKMVDYSMFVLPRDGYGRTYFPIVRRPTGPRPNPPRDLNISEVSTGIRFFWLPPIDNGIAIGYYTIDYKLLADTTWKRLNPTKIEGRTEFIERNMAGLVGERSYEFRVNAHSLTNYESSSPVKFTVPVRLKHKAVIAGVVGGILFFFVAIILSVCAVKICNKRKRRRHEKAYNMVACRVTETRNGGHAHAPDPLSLPKKQSNRISFVRLRRKLLSLRKRLHALLPVNSAAWESRESVDGLWILDRMPKALRTTGPGVRLIFRSQDGRFLSGDSSSNVSDEGGFATARWKRYQQRLDFRSPDPDEEEASPKRRFRTSSPCSAVPPPSAAAVLPSDLSSLQQPSSGERSFPSTVLSSDKGGLLLRNAPPPVATSSPPQVLSNEYIYARDDCYPHYVNVPVICNVPCVSSRWNPDASYTRERLQVAIGRVRSGALLPAHDECRADDRASLASVSSGRGSARMVPPVDVTQESASSGIASRNTSSQPTHSSFAPGELCVESRLQRLQRLSPRKDCRWAPYPIVSVSDHGFDSPGGRASLHSECSPLITTLDASVDTHYEFDAAHLPFPIHLKLAKDRAGEPRNELPPPYSITKLPDHVALSSMEARLHTMRMEYQAFVKRQAQLQPIRRPLETLC